MATKKKSEQVHTGLRMPRELLDRIRVVAKGEGRPVTNMMRVLMEKGLEARQ